MLYGGKGTCELEIPQGRRGRILEIFIGWSLLIPAALYLLRGYTSLRTMIALGYARKCTLVHSFLYILPELILFCLWCMLELHLTVVYVLAFLCDAFRWCLRRNEWSKGTFMVSLTQPLYIAFHMILIGLVSLAVKIPMGLILHKPGWRIVTISTAVAISILADIVILYRPKLQEVLRVQALSEEKRPFMVFLWLCNVFLLLDSLLCIAGIPWSLLPLLLIGAAALKEFFIIRCLFHLYSIIVEHRSEIRNRELSQKLARQERRTEELKNRSDRDTLTGLFSRQYLMEQMELLLEKKQQFSLAYIDLDGLKRINDSQGHAAGDSYLVQFSQYILGRLREKAIFARVGGDEFVIVLSGCSEADAKEKLEKMRSEVAEGKFEHIPAFSFGIAEVDLNTQERAYQLLERADKGMYQDKESRRH